MGILTVVAIVLSAVCSVAIGSEQKVAIDADGWPLRYPVVVCGSEPRIEYVEADPEVVTKAGHGHTKGAIIPQGTRRIIYTIVDMDNATNSQTQSTTDHMMELVESYWERMSHGRLDIEMTPAGRVSIPFSNQSDCPKYDWAKAVDDIVGQQFDLYQYDGRVYFFPGRGACDAGGWGTLYGNSELPIYTGGYANQSWIMIPDAEFIIAHEMGHNFGLHHGSTPHSSQQNFAEYGDRSTIMGDYNYQLPSIMRELRGLHGVNRAFLGWLDPVVEMENNTYTLYASELVEAPGPQILAIPHPWSGVSYLPDVFFLSYRVGGDGIMADGSFAPLQSLYTQGVGLRFAELISPSRTSLYGVLHDGESFYFTDPVHDEHNFFSVYQISHDHEKVTFEVEFLPRPSEESLAAGNCNNGMDDDGDWRMDFGGGVDWTSGGFRYPEGVTCMMTWESISAPANVAIGSEYLVVCESEFPELAGFGPLGDGHLETVSGASGRYVGRFKAASCGEHTFTCGNPVSSVFIRDHLETTVDVFCLYGRTCVDGSCVAFPSPLHIKSPD